ncbi:MAG: hypothetical protein PVI62_15960 [Desulfobacterales bacterium]|jgi:cell division protein FtsL
MSDFKDSINELLVMLLSIAVLMVMVYFQQSLQWNQAVQSRNQQISEQEQKISNLEQELAQTQDTIAGFKASSMKNLNDLKSAQNIIGELEFSRQNSQKELAEMRDVLQKKDEEIAGMKKKAETDFSAKYGRVIELEKVIADQKRQLIEAEETIRRLKEPANVTSE